MNPLIVVADKNKARIFLIARSEEGLGSKNLMQKKVLKNEFIERYREAQKLDSNNLDFPSNSSQQKGGTHARGSTFDNQNSEEDHALSMFCKSLVGTVQKYAVERDADNVLIVAGPQILGMMRSYLKSSSVTYQELARDYSRFDVKEIESALQKEGCIPQSLAYKPRGLENPAPFR